MTSFATLTERIETRLTQHRPDYVAALCPGATDREIDAFEREAEVKLPEAIRALYRWRDGQAETCYDSLLDNWMFSSLAAIADQKRTLDEMIGYDFEDPSWWRRGWVPILDNGGGGAVCLDLTEPGQSPVILFWHDDPDRPLESPSAAEWLTSLAQAIESGAYEPS